MREKEEGKTLKKNGKKIKRRIWELKIFFISLLYLLHPETPKSPQDVIMNF